jgi:hypothetical protein
MSTLPVRTCVNGNALYTPSVNPESIGKAVTWTMTVNTTGAIFVQTGNSAPLHRVLTGTAADAVAVKVGPNAGTLTIVLTYDGSDEGSCSASRIVRKVAVTASYPPLKCAQDKAKITAVATTQSVFNGPFVPSPPYLYTLLPEGTQNLTGIFEDVAAGPHTILAKENMLEGCEAEFAINVIAPPVVIVEAKCPTSIEKNACEFNNQDEVNAQVKAFVDAFDVVGGTGIIQKEKIFEPANGFVDKCGGLLKVTIKGVDECGQRAECFATFKINAAPAVVPKVPAPVVVKFCELTTEDALKEQFKKFLEGFGVSGGCAPQLIPIVHGEPNTCGGDDIEVRFIVRDKCIADFEIFSTFTVERPLAPHIYARPDKNLPACISQADLDKEWDAFLGSVKANSECGPLVVDHGAPIKPDRCLGGDVLVKFVANPNCFPPLVVEAHFRVAEAPKPVINQCPPAKDLGCNPLGLPAADQVGVTSTCAYTQRHVDGPVTGDACNKQQIRTYYISTDCYADAAQCQQTFTWKQDDGIKDLVCAKGGDLGCNPNLDTDLPAPIDPTFTANCPAKVTVKDGPITGENCFKQMVRTYNVATECFPAGIDCTQIFTWKVDLVKPTITKLAQGPTDLGCNPTDAQIEDALGGATANDNCDGDLTAKLDVVTKDKVATGGCGFSITRTWNVKDICGNIADEVSRTVTFKIQEAPTLVCAPDKRIACDAQVIFDDPKAGESCGPVQVNIVSTITSADGNTITRTWEAVNECGLKSAQCSQTIIKEVCDFNGCTLGYWKNHTQAWDCYQTCTLYKDVFKDSTLPEGLTLLQALNLGAGDCNNLARQSVAALLNICDGTLNFKVADIATLQALVNKAFLEGKCGALGAQLDSFNNEGGANHCDVEKSPNDKNDHCNDARTKKGVDATGYVAPTFKVFPNPFTHGFQINSTNITDPVRIGVYDVLGRQVETRLINPQNFDSESFGIDYPTGMYSIMINQATEQKVLRVIKK